MRCFMDTEFTGLHQKTTLISIGCVAEDGRTFYAETTDYDQSQVDEWLQENVIAHLMLSDYDISRDYAPYEEHVRVKGDQELVVHGLSRWLIGVDSKHIEMWSDCLAYDWVLFCELFGGAFGVPKNVYYIPFDLATLFKVKGIDPDISREEYAGLSGGNKHNALWDAQVIQACYGRAMAP